MILYLIVAFLGFTLHFLVELQDAAKYCKEHALIFNFWMFFQDKWIETGISLLSLALLFIMVDVTKAGQLIVDVLPNIFHMDRVIIGVFGYFNSAIWFAVARTMKMVFTKKPI
jgi:hypothetical protein